MSESVIYLSLAASLSPFVFSFLTAKNMPCEKATDEKTKNAMQKKMKSRNNTILKDDMSREETKR